MKIFYFLLVLLNCYSIVYPQMQLSKDQIYGAEKELLEFIKDEISPEGKKVPYLTYYQNKLLKLGQPFNIYYLDINIFRKDTISITSVKDCIHKTDFWLFPVLLKDVYIAILTLKLTNSKWESVSFGRASYSKEIGVLLKAWPKNQITLVEEPGSGVHFFTLQDIDDVNLTMIPGDNFENPTIIEIDKITAYKKLQNCNKTLYDFKNIDR